MTDSQPAAAPEVPQQTPPTGAEKHSEVSDRLSPAIADLASEEFQAMRAEIVARIQKQQDIMNFAILIVTALLTYAGFAKLDSNTLSRTLAALGAPASLALSVFALMTLDHEMNIAHATRYLYQYVRPKWLNAVGVAVESEALEWNVARRTWQQPVGLSFLLPSTMAAAKYYAIILLNLLIVIVSWAEFALHGNLFPIISVILLGLASMLLALTLIASRYTGRIWLGMELNKVRYDIGEKEVKADQESS
jgi:hypothetical protein